MPGSATGFSVGTPLLTQKLSHIKTPSFNIIYKWRPVRSVLI